MSEGEIKPKSRSLRLENFFVAGLNSMTYLIFIYKTRNSTITLIAICGRARRMRAFRTVLEVAMAIPESDFATTMSNILSRYSLSRYSVTALQ